MTKQPGFVDPGHKVEAEILSVKGNCSWGHKPGDKFPISCHDTAGLCGWFYHDIYPYLTMLQFGGSFPAEWGGDHDVIELECMDRVNAVRMQLRRTKE